MLWSINIGTVAGTVIRLHVTFLLFLGWIFLANWYSGGSQAAWTSLGFMILLFACVLAHEFGHIFMARRFGVTTPTVTLLPIGGVAQLERIPEKPSEEFLVAIAGPLVNVVIAAVLVIFFGASLDPRHLAGMDNAAVHMLDRLAAVNIFLVVFNLIPAFPMDGGRVLRALLATRLGYTRATEIAASIGQVVAFGLGFLGLFGNPLLIFIAIFVYLAASSEAQLVAIRAMSRDVPVACRHDDAARAAAARGADRRGGGHAPAHQPERISRGRCRRQARRRAEPRRPDPRAEGARTGGADRRRDDPGSADHRSSRVPGGGDPPAAGEAGARGRRGRCRAASSSA